MNTQRYTAREAAEKVGLSYCYFMRMLREGRFQYHRLAQKIIFFTDEDIESILDGCKVKATNAIVQ